MCYNIITVKETNTNNHNQRKEVLFMRYEYWIFIQKGDTPSNDDRVYGKRFTTFYKIATEVNFLNTTDKFGQRYYFINVTVERRKGFEFV